MTGRRNIIIAISTIVIFAAIVGFFITLDVSPQIAYARLFIDAGLVIGLIAVVMAFYREKTLPTEGIIHALRSFKNGKYSSRLTLEEQHPLNDIALAINELGSALNEQHEKQEEIKRNLREELLPSLKQKESIPLDHSFHPELGPVHTLPHQMVRPMKDQVVSVKDMTPEPLGKRMSQINEQRLSNTLIESNPPEHVVKPEILSEQDLGELYQRFIEAQRATSMDQIEYPLFLKTVEKTTTDLKSTYKCQAVFFDIVLEAGQVALQPKIIR